MHRPYKILIFSLITPDLLIISAVCWHSVEEIHYLKTFYPKQFSVQEAFYAGAVELIKVIIFCVPFFFVIIIGFGLLFYWQRKS